VCVGSHASNISVANHIAIEFLNNHIMLCYAYTLCCKGMRYHYQAHSVPGKPMLRVAHDLRELAIAELSASAAWLIQKVMISILLLITHSLYVYSSC
jgi:hypothetical protein